MRGNVIDLAVGVVIGGAFGKIVEGQLKVGESAICRHGNGKITKGKITMLYHFEGMKRIEISEASAGDIVGVAGFENVFIGESLCDSEARASLPYIPIDPPTIQMEFAVNDGGAEPSRILKGMEGIVRKTWKAYPNCDICFVYTVTEALVPPMLEGNFPRAV